MNGIVMIPVDQLYHHPENPRKDLGDLTELAESIRENGVMQNLTVVPGHRMTKAEWTAAARAEGADKASAESSYDPENAEVSDGFTVVIGNRRMEASKMAGLDAVPCVISDMDHKTQISTMLMENMQRADLTVYEQAQGFQMMMDLGFTAQEIGEKTGFSLTTVNRRIKMAELDKKAFQKAVGQQITMDALDRLGQVEDLKKRNELLEEYGERDFDWKLNMAIKKQKAGKVREKARRILKDAKLQQIPEKDRYTLYKGGYEKLYGNTCELDKWDGKSNIIPKVEGDLYWNENGTDIDFYVKRKKQKAEPVKKTPEELAEEKKRDLAWKTVDRVATNAAELRERFAEGLNVSPKNAMRTLQWALIAAFSAMMNYESPTAEVKKRLGIEGTNIPENVANMGKKMMELPQSKWPGLILLMFEGNWRENSKKPPAFAYGSRSYQLPKYCQNVPMELCYNWLTENGYQMSTEEIEMMAGTHPVFQTEVEV